MNVETKGNSTCRTLTLPQTANPLSAEYTHRRDDNCKCGETIKEVKVSEKNGLLASLVGDHGQSYQLQMRETGLPDLSKPLWSTDFLPKAKRAILKSLLLNRGFAPVQEESCSCPPCHGIDSAHETSGL
jgi:hypothetical protein